MFLGFPCGSAGKESSRNAGDLGLILGLGRSPGEGKGHPLQYSGLENSMDCLYSPWSLKESDTDERVFTSTFYQCFIESIFKFLFYYFNLAILGVMINTSLCFNVSSLINNNVFFNLLIDDFTSLFYGMSVKVFCH